MSSKLLVSDGGCYVIAEAGLNHNGSMTLAKQLIDIAAKSGADAVKFQKRNVKTLATSEVLYAKDDRFPEFGSTYEEIRNYLEFNFSEYEVLKDYSEQLGLDFIVTAFDEISADFLDKLGLNTFKIASHSLTNYDLLEYVAQMNKTIVLSTGMAELSEIDMAMEIFSRNSTPIVLMHCVSSYPTPDTQCNLEMLSILRKRYAVDVGYSGHEIGFLPTTIAVAMGAVAIERHFTIDNNMEGFDHKISLEPDELKKMVSEIRLIEQIKGSGKKIVSDIEQITRNKYHVSMVSACALRLGTALSADCIVYKNPGTGIAKKNEKEFIGRILKVNVEKDVLLTSDMFE